MARARGTFTEGGHASQDGGAARHQDLDRLFDGRPQPDRLDAELGPAAGDASDRLRRRRRIRVGLNDVGGAEAARDLELLGDAVDADDAARAASTAPITADSPTPPSPMTHTDAPTGTAAVFSTAPTPVDTQQPINAATSGELPAVAELPPSQL